MSAARPTNVRYLMLLMLGLAAASAYLTRIIASANTTIGQEFGVSDAVMGQVMAGFALGYFVFQIPGGLLGSWIGVRKVFPVISGLWALSCWWMTRAETIEELKWARIAVGVSQAGLVPCCGQVLADWFPASRRGIGGSVVGLSMQVGGILATSLTANLLARHSWRDIFAWYSLTGVAWAVAFALLYRDRPERHPWVNAAELDLICGGAPPPAPQPGQPFLARTATLTLLLLGSVSLWLICVQSFFRAFGYELYATWYPAYLEYGFDLSKTAAGELAAYPIGAFGLGALVGGPLVDLLYHRTGSKRLSRSGQAAFGLGGAAACTLAGVGVADPTALTALLSVGVFFAGMAGPATWAATLDVSGRHSGLVFGIMNFAGNVGSYVCPLSVGWLVTFIRAQDEPRWDWLLYLFTAINLAGALTWLFINPNRSAVTRPAQGHG